MMKKLCFYFISLSFLFISCKKQDYSGASQGVEKDPANVSARVTPVVAPTLFFMTYLSDKFDDGELFQVDNLLAAKPVVNKKASLEASPSDTKGFLNREATWAYNTTSNEIWYSANNYIFHTLSTNTYQFGAKFISGANYYNFSNHLRISPDNSTVYRIAGSLGGKVNKAVLAIDKVFNSIFDDEPNTKITAMDIDFLNEKIYIVDAVSASIYKLDLDGSNKIKVASIVLGESVEADAYPILRVDPKNNKLYLSTHSNKLQIVQKFKLWSLSTSGKDWKKLFEAVDTSPSNNHSSFYFDLWPGNKIFYSLYQEIPNYPISLVYRMDLDGSNNTFLFASKRIVRNLVMAIPFGK